MDEWMVMSSTPPSPHSTSAFFSHQFQAGDWKILLWKNKAISEEGAPWWKSPGAIIVNSTSWQGPVTQTELPMVFSASLSVWTLSQRSPDMWAKLPDRRNKQKKMDKRNWREKETMQGTKEKYNSFPPLGKKMLIQIFCSNVISPERRPSSWPLCPKQHILLCSIPSPCLISERDDREMVGRKWLT